MSKRKVVEENQKAGSDLLLLFVGMILVLYAIYCVILTLAYGLENWGYALFFLFMAFAFVFIGKGIIDRIRALMIAGFLYFLLYTLFVTVASIFYEYNLLDTNSLLFLILNVVCAGILFIRLDWYKKIKK